MAVKRKKAGSEIMLIDALKDLCAEKEIDQNTLFDAIEMALISACKKSASADKNVVVDLDRSSGAFHVYELRNVVEEVTNSNKEISLDDARKIKPTYEIGDVVREEVMPKDFGRIAAQAAKQFVMQKIREAERGVVYDEFTNKDNDVVTGTIIRIEDGNAIVDIGKTEAVLVPVEQIYTDRLKVGDRVRAYVAEVRKISKGPQVYLSRTHPGFLRRLFELEVPEIQDGLIVIKGVAREAGNRSKIAVYSENPDIDAVGACLGEHGVRAQAIAKELNNEKIDVVKWDEDPALFIANALSPSKVMKISVNDYARVSHVVVPNNQLSLAIGKEGQNARLAAKITGWKIDIKSKSQAQEQGEENDPDLREVRIGGDRPKKQKPQKPQKQQKQPKPPVAPLLDENGQPIPPENTGKKKKKKKKKNAAATQNVAATSTNENPFGDNPFGDNLFDDNPFGDNPFDNEETAAPVEKPVAAKTTQNAPAENLFGDNPFGDNLFGDNSFDENPFGDNSFETEQAETKPAEKSAAKVEENHFGDNSFETEQAETKPAEKSAAKVEENPFGDNSFESEQAETKPAEKPAKKKPAKKPKEKKAEPKVDENPFGDNPFDDNPFGDNPFEN